MGRPDGHKSIGVDEHGVYQGSENKVASPKRRRGKAKRCKIEGCITILCSYNGDDYCRAHRRVGIELEQARKDKHRDMLRRRAKKVYQRKSKEKKCLSSK